MKNIIKTLLLTCVFSLSGMVSAQSLHVANVFSDHAVLQQGAIVPVWGTGVPNAIVKVSFAGQKHEVVVNRDGKWRVHLKPLQASTKGKNLKVNSGDAEVIFNDILVGEVWYASGQSNMQMNLASCGQRIKEIKQIIDRNDTGNIRYLRVHVSESEKRHDDLHLRLGWHKDEKSKRGTFSGAAYLFAYFLEKELNVPVGIIEGSWGGKPIEGFIPRADFKRYAELQPILKLSDANKLEELKKLEGGVIIRNSPGMPGRIFHSRVAPIPPFTIKGVIWYQAESNAGTGEDPRNYRIKMKALVEGWRREWANQKLPFYYVQLPPFRDSATGWVRVREEQRLAMDIPHTGMAVTIDLPDEDIHPANKLDVAKRLMLWALNKQYGKDVIYSGPLYKNIKIETDKVIVSFEHTGDGLKIGHKNGVDAVRFSTAGELNHFELADAEGKWYPAKANIHNKHKVVVQSEHVKKPLAVRYACSGGVKNANLYNAAGLPASPFCSRLDMLPWIR